MPGTGQGQAGTCKDKARTNSDKAGTNREIKDILGQPLYVPACPCLSLSLPVCSCLSLSVLFYPCLSLSVPVCLNICHACISPPGESNIVTLTLLEKATVPMHANLMFNFFSLCHFGSCFLNNPFILSKQVSFSDLFHYGLHLVLFL